MSQAFCLYRVEAGEKDFTPRIPPMRSGLRLLTALFFTALHAAALMLPDARAQTPDIALHAGWGEAGSQPAVQLTEGNSAFLTVRATGLSGEAPLEVRIEADLPLEANFSNSVILKGPEFSTKMKVTAKEDGNPEPREEMEFRVSAPDHPAAAPATAELTIPRHGYALESLTIPRSRLHLGETVRAQARLNAPTPHTASITFRFIFPGGAINSELSIHPGEQIIEAEFPNISRTGSHRVRIQRISFIETALASGDQQDWTLNNRVQLFQVFETLDFRMSVAPQTAPEGGEVSLRLEARNLLENESLTVALTTDEEHSLDSDLAESSLTLTANAPQRSVSVTALEDKLPEPREEIVVTARADLRELTPVRTGRFVIPRHGYAVDLLQLAPALLERDPETGVATLTVTAGLNGTEPASAAVLFVHAAPAAGGEPAEMRMTIPAGASTATVKLGLNAEGVYAVSATRARFVSGAPLDQLDLAVTALPQTAEVTEAFAPLRLALDLQDSILKEGSLTALTISIEGRLPAGQEHKIQLSANPAGQIEFIGGNSVTLTAQARSRSVRVRAVNDAEAERRQTVELSAQAAGLETSASLVIARNDYRADAVTVAALEGDFLSEIESGGEFFLVLVINRPLAADDRVELTLQAVHEHASGRATTTETLAFTKNNANGHGGLFYRQRRALVQPGTYTWTVLDARFTNLKALDQEALLGRERLAPFSLRVTPPLPPQLSATLDRNLAAEGDGAVGETATLTVSVSNLAPEGHLQVSISVPDASSNDLSFEREHLVLTGSEPSATVQVQVINDDAPEPREHIEITASAPGAVSATAALTIPRDDYVMVSAELSVSQVRLGGDANLIVRLNGPTPGQVTVFGDLNTPLGEVFWVLFIDPEDSALPPDTGVWRLLLGGAGEYSLDINAAYFNEFEYRDQEDIEILDNLLEFVVPEEGGAGLSLQLSGLLQGEAAEGSLLLLKVTGDNLLIGGSLDVQLSAGMHGADVDFSTTAFRLTAESSSRTVEVTVREDHLAEPRETVRLEATALSGGSVLRRTEEFAIPRHGYEASLQAAPAAAIIGRVAELRVQLNGNAPSALLATVRATPALDPSRGASELLQARIEENQSVGAIPVIPLQARDYVFTLESASFAPGIGTDQSRPAGAGSSATLRVFYPAQLSLRLDRDIIQEGTTATLTVRLRNLQSDDPVEVDLEAVGRTDVAFSSSTVHLSAAAQTATVTIELLQDDLPEPRELITLRGSANVDGEMQEAGAVFVAPREGYTAVLRVRPEIVRPGTTATVEVEMNNAAVPEAAGAASVFLEIRFGEGAKVGPSRRLQINAGETSGRITFTPETVGEYRISERTLKFGASIVNDQIIVPLTPETVILRALDPSRLEATLTRSFLAEGSTSALRVTAKNLLPGETLEVELSADSAAEIELLPTRVTLSATAPTQEVLVTALADGAAPEPRETVLIRAGASADGITLEHSAELAIARHGYAVTALNAPAQIRAGADLLLQARLNGPAPTAAHLTVEIERNGASQPAMTLTVAPGADAGSLLVPVIAAGSYVFRVSAAEFETFDFADQQAIDVERHRALLEARSETLRAQLSATLDRNLAAEGDGAVGETAMLTVSVSNLAPGGRLQVSIAVPDASSNDLSFDRAQLVLTGSEPSTTVRVQVVNDDAPEPREHIEITASAPGAVSATAALTIPRDDYVLTSVELSVPRVNLDTDADMIVRLNAPAPALVSVVARLRRPGDLHLLSLIIEPGGEVEVLPVLVDNIGNHILTVYDVIFLTSLPRDQVEIELLNNELEFLVLEQDGPGLSLQLSGLLQGEAAEGGALRLSVIGDVLLSGELLEVQLSAGVHGADVDFSTTAFRLTAESSSRTVEVTVREDHLAEPREAVRLEATALSGGSMLRRTAEFAIPRHGYAASLQVAPTAAVIGRAAELRVQLNGNAPSALLATVRATPALDPDRGASELLQARIEENQSVGAIPVIPLQARDYVFTLESASFAPGIGTDQSRPAGAGSSTTLRAFDPAQLSLSLDRRFLQEGTTATLTVRIQNLLSDAPTAVNLEAVGRSDVAFSSSTVYLSAAAPSATVTVELLRDDVPEPREKITLRGSANVDGELQEARAVFVASREGYTAVLRVRPEIVRPGTTATVEVEMNNAAVPEAAAAASVFMETRLGAGLEIGPSQRLRIGAGETSGRITFIPDTVGEYWILAQPLRFAVSYIVESDPEGNDQKIVPLTPETVILRVLDPSRLEATLTRSFFGEDLASTLTMTLKDSPPDETSTARQFADPETGIALDASLDRRTPLSEGERAVLRVSALNLPPGDAVTVRIAPEEEEQWHLSANTITLSAAAPQAEAQLELRDDGLAEPDRELRLQFSAVGRPDVRPTLLSVMALRSDYRAESVTAAPARMRFGDRSAITVTLNAPAPKDVNVEVLAVDANSGTPADRVLMRIHAGERAAIKPDYSPPTAGVFALSVSDASFFDGIGAVDFAEAAAARLTAAGEPELAELELRRNGTPAEFLEEGDVAILSVGVEHLPPGETVRVLLRAAPDSGDVMFSQTSIELSGERRSREVEVRITDDALAEDRERAELLASAPERAGMEERAMSMFILRNDFIARVKVTPSETPVGAAVTVEAELNAPAPAAAVGSVTLHRVLEGGETEESVESPVIEIAAGETAASVRVRLTERGVYHGVSDNFRFVSGLESEREIAGHRVSGLARAGVRASLSVAPARLLLPEGEQAELHLQAGGLGESSWGSDEVLRVAALYDEEELELIDALPLEISGGRGASARLRLRAREDGRAEPRETLTLRLSGTSRYTLEPSLAEAVVTAPRHGYRVKAMKVRTSARHPSDAFDVRLTLNAPAPTTVRATVQALPRDADLPAKEMTLFIAPGETSGAGTINMRAVGDYILSTSGTRFMRWEGGDQVELEAGTITRTVRVHALLDYDGSGIIGINRTTAARQVDDFTRYFQAHPNLRVLAGPEFCTEEARTAPSPAGRLPCLDVSGDGFADAVDIALITEYLRNWHHIYRNIFPMRFFLIRVEGYENASDAEAGRLMRNIQSLFPRTENICRYFRVPLCEEDPP